MRKLLFGLLLTVTATGAMADETRGPVVYSGRCGPLIVINTPQGYVVGVWQYGVMPPEGHTVVGEWNAYEVRRAYDINTDGGGEMRVVGFGLSRGRAMQALKNRCR
jgi:hypothetical protein